MSSKNPEVAGGGGGRPGEGLSLSLRLSLWFALVFTLTSMGLYALAFVMVRGLTERAERGLIESRVERYTLALRRGGLAELQRQFAFDDAGGDGVFYVRVAGPNMGAELWSDDGTRPGLEAEIRRSMRGLEPGRWLLLPEEGDGVVLFLASAEVMPGVVLQVGKTSRAYAQLGESFGKVFWRIVVPAIVLGILGGALLTFRATRPVRALVATVREIIRTGDLGTRVPPVGGAAELTELVGLCNEMLQRQDRLVTTMRESLDHVAHDLRTPMTRLRSTAEEALTRAGDPEAAREALADCMEESERVLTMLNALMDVAEAETGAMRLVPEDVDLAKVVPAVADVYELVAEEKGVVLHVRVDEGTVARADEARLRQVVGNLVDNAIKYSGAGGEVWVRARREGDGTVVEVSDRGVGIPPGELPKIWNRLYRGDRSRRRERGLGLGLSVVKAVVEAHGGSVAVASTPGEGSTFTVRLPAGGRAGPDGVSALGGKA